MSNFIKSVAKFQAWSNYSNYYNHRGEYHDPSQKKYIGSEIKKKKNCDQPMLDKNQFA